MPTTMPPLPLLVSLITDAIPRSRSDDFLKASPDGLLVSDPRMLLLILLIVLVLEIETPPW